MKETHENPLFTVREAGEFLRPKKRMRDNMRWTGTNFRKHGGRGFYHIDELRLRSLM